MGFGIVAYFKMLRGLIITFFFISIMYLLITYVYSEHFDIRIPQIKYDLAQYSIGNLGYSSTVCRSFYATIDKGFTYSCRNGTSISNLYSFGLIP